MSKKTLTILIIVIVLAVAGVSAALLYNLYGSPGPSSLTEKTFPTTLAGMNLAQISSGNQAMGMISQLHGKQITVKQGFIAQYAGTGGSQMTLWISESNSAAEAVQLMEIMDKKIPASKAFTGRKEITANNTKAIYVQGMGMDNYYWQQGDRVYWIAVGGADSMQLLQEVMKSFQ